MPYLPKRSYEMYGAAIAYDATRVLCAVERTLCPISLRSPMPCPLPTLSYDMPGTSLVYGIRPPYCPFGISLRSPTPCPALLRQYHPSLLRERSLRTTGSSLRACYATSGTAIAYAPISLHARFALSGADTYHIVLSAYAMSNTDLRMMLHVCCYALATRSPVLTFPYGPTEPFWGRILSRYHPPTYWPTRLLRDVRRDRDGTYSAICLRACYAMSGTALAYAAGRLRMLCDVRYPHPVCRYQPRRMRCDFRTETQSAYALAMPCPVLTCVYCRQMVTLVGLQSATPVRRSSIVRPVLMLLYFHSMLLVLIFHGHASSVVLTWAHDATRTTRSFLSSVLRIRHKSMVQHPTLLRRCYARSGTSIARAYHATLSQYDNLSCPRLCCYACTMQCPVMLRHYCYGMSGTDVAYAASRRVRSKRSQPEDWGRCRISYRPGIKTPLSPTHVLYTMSGTEVVHAAIGLRACYAMSGTDLASAATVCYALSDTTYLPYANGGRYKM
eukprot:3189239-Rhodomonas_salina.7